MGRTGLRAKSVEEMVCGSSLVLFYFYYDLINAIM